MKGGGIKKGGGNIGGSIEGEGDGRSVNFVCWSPSQHSESKY